MKTPIPSRRPLPLYQRIRRRQRGEDYQSPTAHIIRALDSFVYGAGGLFIDLYRRDSLLFNLGTGDIFGCLRPSRCWVPVGFLSAIAGARRQCHNPQASNNAYQRLLYTP